MDRTKLAYVLGIFLAAGIVLTAWHMGYYTPCEAVGTGEHIGNSSEIASGTVKNEPHPAGEIVFAIKDSAANMSNIGSVNVAIGGVGIRNATGGWMDIMPGESSFDLLELKNEGIAVLLYKADLPAGAYNAIRLSIRDGSVVENGTRGEILFSTNNLEIAEDVNIYANKTSAVVLDFIASASLHETEDGSILMFPVVNVTLKENATVNISGDKNVVIIYGDSRLNAIFGTNQKGEFGKDIKFEKDAGIFVENGSIRVAKFSASEVASIGRACGLEASSISLTGKFWILEGTNSSDGSKIRIKIDSDDGNIVETEEKYDKECIRACEQKCNSNGAEFYVDCTSRTEKECAAECEADINATGLKDCMHKTEGSCPCIRGGLVKTCVENYNSAEMPTCVARCHSNATSKCGAESASYIELCDRNCTEPCKNF